MKIIHLFGVQFGYSGLGQFIAGNRFSPSIIVRHHSNRRGQHANWSLTIGGASKQTEIYWDGALDFWWNSAHLARWFGKFHDTDFGGYHQWCGHLDL